MLQYKQTCYITLDEEITALVAVQGNCDRSPILYEYLSDRALGDRRSVGSHVS